MELDSNFELNNILFYGGSSLLAQMWTNTFEIKKNIFLTQHIQEIKIKGCQILNVEFEIPKKKLISIIKKNKIKVVINCVGLTNVEKCQNDLDNANFLNSRVPQILAKVCESLKIKFVHISTDHLFDGKKSFYDELEIPNPLNIYAKSKYIGEKNVINSNKESLIIRTNFFGEGPNYKPSFSDTIISSLKDKKHISLFTDVFYTPIHIRELARTCEILIKEKQKGIFNVVSKERISKYDFGIMIAKKLNFSEELILQCKISDRDDLKKRPKDMSLSNKKIHSILNQNIIPLEEQIGFLNNN